MSSDSPLKWEDERNNLTDTRIQECCKHVEFSTCFEDKHKFFHLEFISSQPKHSNGTRFLEKHWLETLLTYYLHFFSISLLSWSLIFSWSFQLGLLFLVSSHKPIDFTYLFSDKLKCFTFSVLCVFLLNLWVIWNKAFLI